MKIFFISPVRQATDDVRKKCEEYVAYLEKQGHEAHWPMRDTDQNDPIGIQICDTNLGKILEADEIHVYYDKTSTGIHFDLGGTYMLIRILGYKKRVVFVNAEDFKEEIVGKGKSYLRVLDRLDFLTKEANNESI